MARKSIRIRLNGKVRTLQEWCEHYDMNYKTVYSQIKAGKKPIEIFAKAAQKQTEAKAELKKLFGDSVPEIIPYDMIDYICPGCNLEVSEIKGLCQKCYDKDRYRQKRIADAWWLNHGIYRDKEQSLNLAALRESEPVPTVLPILPSIESQLEQTMKDIEHYELMRMFKSSRAMVRNRVAKKAKNPAPWAGQWVEVDWGE